MSSSTSSSDPERGTRRPSPLLGTLGFLVTLTLTILVVGRTLRGLSAWLDPNYVKVGRMMALAGRDDEVLYLGDSTTLDGVDPEVVREEVGIRGYNLATGGQGLVESQMVLRHYLEHNDPPKVVMLGVFVDRARGPETINPNVYLSLSRGERALYRDLVSRYGGRPLELGFEVLNRIEAFRFRRAIEYGIKLLAGGRSRIPRIVSGHVKIDFSRGYELGPEHEVALNRDALRGLLDLCEEVGIPVLMYEPPAHPGYSARSRGRAALVAMLEEEAALRPGVEFRSFNDESSLEFADGEWMGLNHLNARGAERFSREQISPYLRAFMEKAPRDSRVGRQSPIRGNRVPAEPNPPRGTQEDRAAAPIPSVWRS